MELRILKRLYLLPWLRLNLYTRGVSISVGRRGWAGSHSAAAESRRACQPVFPAPTSPNAAPGKNFSQ